MSEVPLYSRGRRAALPPGTLQYSAPLGPYSTLYGSPMGGGRFLMSEVPLYRGGPIFRPLQGLLESKDMRRP